MECNLELQRISKNMTQAEVAKMAGISRVHYTQIENGKRTPSVKVARNIGNVLGIDWTNFFVD